MKPTCPTCGEPQLVRHCKNCGWLQCCNCLSFGDRDLRRWVKRPYPEHQTG